MKVDILVIGAHPDDIELCAAGTILSHIDKGYSVGLVDLTQGELGTRGNAEIRLEEAANAARILGVSFRENLAMPDGFFEHNRENIAKIAAEIRKAQPSIILANAISDRHPDHGRAAKLVSDACFYSGLRRFQLEHHGEELSPWRPSSLFHYIQDYHHEPDFVVDISAYYEKKEQAILAFKSQFYDPDSNEPDTPISSKEFLEFLKGRAMDYGRSSGFKYAEGFLSTKRIGVKDLGHLF